MALTEVGRISITIAALSILAFIFGVVAKNKKVSCLELFHLLKDWY